jgi:hypothetical protein
MIRSDNGPEFVAKAVQKWITAVGAKMAYIAPGPHRGEDRHRKLAAVLQHGASARLARIQATGSGGLRTRYDRAVGSATPTVGEPTEVASKVANTPTFHPDSLSGPRSTIAPPADRGSPRNSSPAPRVAGLFVPSGPIR